MFKGLLAAAALFALSGVAHATNSYDITSKAVFSITSDGKSHLMLASPVPLTGTWHVTGTVNVGLAYGNYDLACYAGQNRADMLNNQTAQFQQQSMTVDGLVTANVPTTIGFACAVYVSPGNFGTPEFLNVHLTLVPVSPGVNVSQSAPRS